MPKMALNKEVETKYNNVRKAIRPFILAFRLADPDIKLAITKGRIINLRTRMNSSPGYDINIIDSASRWAGRRPKPGKKWKIKYNIKTIFDWDYFTREKFVIATKYDTF